MRPARTAITTAALRRTTQRLVLGGGRSSLTARSSAGELSSTLLTVPCQDFGGPERPVASRGLLAAGPAAQCRVTLQRGLIGGGGSGLGRQCTGGRAARNAVAADKGGHRGLILFTTHRQCSQIEPVGLGECRAYFDLAQ